MRSLGSRKPRLGPERLHGGIARAARVLDRDAPVALGVAADDARHVARAAPRDRPLVRAWRRRAQLYACAAGGNDDWYWLAAAVAAGDAGWLVSNDEMRDHHFGMLSRGDFLRWKARTVVKFEMDGGDVALAPPPPYSESAQFDAGGWHVPARVGAGAGEASAATVVVRRPAPGALAWLCCAPAPSVRSQQQK